MATDDPFSSKLMSLLRSVDLWDVVPLLKPPCQDNAMHLRARQTPGGKVGGARDSNSPNAPAHSQVFEDPMIALLMLTVTEPRPVLRRAKAVSAGQILFWSSHGAMV